ncbi:unnamed protein product [Prorocentrum cordatum]|uniref:Poly(ADP-ribose) glycohydrolase n=1 Tax=Prorocentrum cordatum TaxID=2364126 RepID=A0ABN9RKW8_9DINO|nr:unnamed protein product [Polarella glacialis]
MRRRVLLGAAAGAAVCQADDGQINACCLSICEVDFGPDFCLASCRQPRFRDGVDWRRSRLALDEAAEARRLLLPGSPLPGEQREFLTEAAAVGARTCPPAALAAEAMLGVAWLAEEATSWVVEYLRRVSDPAVLVLAGWPVFFDVLSDGLGAYGPADCGAWRAAADSLAAAEARRPAPRDGARLAGAAGPEGGTVERCGLAQGGGLAAG